MRSACAHLTMHHAVTHGYTEVLFGDVECLFGVAPPIALVQLVIIEKFWSMLVNQSASSVSLFPHGVAIRHSQSKTVGEALLEVPNFHPFVTLSLTLTPQQQTVSGGQTLFSVWSATTRRVYPTYVILAMVKRRMRVQIIPRMSFKLPSTISSGPRH